MALARRASVPTNTGSTTSMTVTKPTGTTGGDLIVAVFGLADQGGTSIAAPDGTWTQELLLDSATPGGQTLAVFWKIASSEPASWTFTTTLGTGADGNHNTSCMAFYDDAAAASAIIYDSATLEDTSGSTQTTSSITTLADDDIVISAFVQDQTGSDGAWAASSPGGLTELSETWSPAGNCGLAVYEEVRSAAGSGAHSATQTTGGDNTRGSATGILAIGLAGGGGGSALPLVTVMGTSR